MRSKNIIKRILAVLGIIVTIFVLCIIGLFIKQSIIDTKINNDFSNINSNKKYQKAVAIDGVKILKQKISCGYACIQMLSEWSGKNITEQTLLEQNGGKITTAMGNGFCTEMNKQFPEYKTIKYTNLTNTELIDKVYDSLANGMPVPFEFAAKYKSDDKEVWTLHFAVVTAMNIPHNKITVCNPYGYEEIYTVQKFLNATRYDSYENMEFYFKLGFAAGIFSKNTIYVIK